MNVSLFLPMTFIWQEPGWTENNPSKNFTTGRAEGVGSGRPPVASLTPDLLLSNTQTPLVTGRISFLEMYPWSPSSPCYKASNKIWVLFWGLLVTWFYRSWYFLSVLEIWPASSSSTPSAPTPNKHTKHNPCQDVFAWTTDFGRSSYATDKTIKCLYPEVSRNS